MKANAALAAALLVVLAILALSGLALLRLIFGAWRHFDHAQRPVRHRRPMPDIWQAGGDRLIARLEQQRRASPGDDHDQDGGPDAKTDGREPPPAAP